MILYGNEFCIYIPNKLIFQLQRFDYLFNQFLSNTLIFILIDFTMTCTYMFIFILFCPLLSMGTLINNNAFNL